MINTNLPEPKFIQEDMFRTIVYLQVSEQVTEQVTGLVTGQVTGQETVGETAGIILNLIKNNPKITRQGLSKETAHYNIWYYHELMENDNTEYSTIHKCENDSMLQCGNKTK